MKITKALILGVACVAALVGAATAIIIFRGEITDFFLSMKEKFLGSGDCCCGESGDFEDM